MEKAERNKYRNKRIDIKNNIYDEWNSKTFYEEILDFLKKSLSNSLTSFPP